MKAFLEALSALPGLEATTLDWRRMLGPDTFAWAAPFLRHTGRIATAVHCPFGCGCAHEIAPGDDHALSEEPGRPGMMTAVCVCEDLGGCPDFPVAKNDLETLQADPARIGREIARELHCRPLHAALDGARAWQIGSWSAGAVPVFLTFATVPGALAVCVAHCAARLRSRFILLMPELEALDVRSRELLAQTSSGAFGLGEILRTSASGRFEALRPPEELFAAFTTEPPDADDGGIRKAFKLIETLERESPGNPPGLVTVFKLYCVDQLTTAEIARKCGCSKTTVIERLSRLRKATGAEPAHFRRFSTALEDLRNRDSRARTARCEF